MDLGKVNHPLTKFFVVNRRNLILGVAAAAASLAALLRLDSIFDVLVRPPPSKGTLKIDSIGVVNDHDEPHELALTVRYDGDQIHSEQYDLGTSPDAQTASIEDLPTEAGAYQLKASLSDGQTSRLVPKYYADEDCAESVIVLVNSDGHLSPFFIEPCQQQS